MTGRGGQADATYLLEATGPAAPPRDNGELIFASPWESQAFGLALALREAGHIDWQDFRQRLITEIARAASHGAGDDWSYYRCWLRALERTVSDRGLVGAADLLDRTAVLAARPPDHGPADPDHDHDHDHAATASSGASHAH